jgi:hypothetical protein
MTPILVSSRQPRLRPPPRSRLGPRAIETPLRSARLFAAAIYSRIGSSLRMEKARPALCYAMRAGQWRASLGAKRRAVGNFDLD